MEGVNNCTSHCSLARFRVLMIKGKYGATTEVAELIP